MPELFIATCTIDTKLVKALAWLSAIAVSYSTLKKLQEEHYLLATGHMWFVNPPIN